MTIKKLFRALRARSLPPFDGCASRNPPSLLSDGDFGRTRSLPPAIRGFDTIRALCCRLRAMHSQGTNGVACAVDGERVKRFGPPGAVATTGQEGVCGLRVAPLRPRWRSVPRSFSTDSGVPKAVAGRPRTLEPQRMWHCSNHSPRQHSKCSRTRTPWNYTSLSPAALRNAPSGRKSEGEFHEKYEKQ